MAQIKHIAIATQDSKKTAQFYQNLFGLKQVVELDGPTARGFFLSDGNINMAILDFKNDEAAGVERGMGYSGLHHIGFEVESLEQIANKMEAANANPRYDINQAMKLGASHQRHGNVEVKYAGPDGVIIDVSETGWVGTRDSD